MKIVVIGGSGFLGKRLVSSLLDLGHEVVIGDLEPITVCSVQCAKVDVCDPDGLCNLLDGADVVINLAAVHRDDIKPISLYYDINVGGARAICEAAEQKGVKTIIFTSSVAIYGTTAQDEICPEERDPCPFNDYGRSKLEAESVYRDWSRGDCERRLVIVRPTVIFGEENRGNVYNLMRQVADGRFLMIGKGDNRKSVAYVGNVASFLCHCLTHSERFEVFNYVDKPDLSVSELVALIRKALGRRSSSGFAVPYVLGWIGGALFDLLAKLTGRTFPISRIRIMKFCANTRFCSAAAMATGFVPPFPLEDAVERTVRYEFTKGE